MEVIRKKLCKVCSNEYILEEGFYKNKYHKDGHSAHCKKCQDKYSRKSAIKAGRVQGLRRLWPEEDLQYVRDNYAHGDIGTMVAHLNKTGKSNTGEPYTKLNIRCLINKASYMGLGGTRRAHNAALANAKPKLVKVKAPKPVKVKPEKPAKVYHKELPRFKEKVFASRQVNVQELELVKINRRTQIYLRKDLTADQRSEIIEKYRGRVMG